MEQDLVILVAIGVFFTFPVVMLKIWSNHKREMLKLNQKLNDSDKLNINNELAGVKKRLEVLEAIVTDKKYQLDREISELEVTNSVN